jgi:molybdenum cofactor cytidylyltransferase
VIAGVVLAAGASRRFGSQKLLAPVGGVPLARRSVQALLDASVDQVLVVLGSDAPAVGAALAGLEVRIVTNPAYASGMSTSLRAGIDALDPRTDAVVVALGDQPGVPPEIVDRLVDRYLAARAPIVAPLYRGGVRGNPVLFDRSLFDELRAVTGDEGGRAVVAKDPGRVVLVEFAQEMPRDVDVPEDMTDSGPQTAECSP